MKSSTSSVLFPVIIPLLFLLSGTQPLKPSDRFMSLVRKMEMAGCRPDTSRIRKVSGYNHFHNETMHLSKGYPVYNLKFAEHPVHRANNGLWNDKADLAPLEKVSAIFGYFYVAEQRKDLLEDGAIEEWIFPSHEDAVKAGQLFGNIRDRVFFNTESYVAVREQSVFVFHTRAAAFYPRLKQNYSLLR